MQFLYGKVIEFLHDATGRVNGFALDRGEQIRFLPDQIDLVTAIVNLNSRIEISGDLRMDRVGEKYLEAAQITSVDSRRTASLSTPVSLGKPGILSDGAPNRAASLAHRGKMGRERPAGSEPNAEESSDLIGLFFEKMASQARPSRYAADENARRRHLPLLRATRCDAATGIERAYDKLHRIQEILAYLNITKRQVPGISQFLDEAKHTYEQALSRYGAQDYEGAREFATASECLSHVVEGVISRTLRSDTSYPSLVPLPPEHAGTCGDSNRVQDDLNEIEVVLSRIHWLMENGTLPMEDRTQVRRIASWSDAFYQQARRMHERGSQEDATELVEAANAAALSAEHICRNWYVARAIGSHMIT